MLHAPRLPARERHLQEDYVKMYIKMIYYDTISETLAPVLSFSLGRTFRSLLSEILLSKKPYLIKALLIKGISTYVMIMLHFHTLI